MGNDIIEASVHLAREPAVSATEEWLLYAARDGRWELEDGRSTLAEIEQLRAWWLAEERVVRVVHVSLPEIP